MILPNFTVEELMCRCGCGLFRFAPGFLQALQGLRDALLAEYLKDAKNVPVKANYFAAITLNSACRCKEYNATILGHPRSLHVGDYPHWPTRGTCAVDVRAIVGRDDEYREKLAKIAWERGWSVGFHSKFLHLDLRGAYTSLSKTKFNY